MRSSSASRSSWGRHVAALGTPQGSQDLLQRPPVALAGHQRGLGPGQGFLGVAGEAS